MLAPRPSRTLVRIAVTAAVGVGVAIGSMSVASAAWAEASQSDGAAQSVPADDPTPDDVKWD